MKTRMTLEEKNKMLLKKRGYIIKLIAENKCLYRKTDSNDVYKFEQFRTPEGEQVQQLVLPSCQFLEVQKLVPSPEPSSNIDTI